MNYIANGTNSWLVIILTIITNPLLSFASENSTTTTVKPARGPTEPTSDVVSDDDVSDDSETNARHTAIVYFCLFSLLLLHMACVIIACMLCFRHAINNSGWFGNRNGTRDEENTTGNNAASRDSLDEYLVFTKSVQKDLFLSFDSPKTSPYRIEFVHHEHQSRQPIKVPFVGYDLPKFVETTGAKDSDKRISTCEDSRVTINPSGISVSGIDNPIFNDDSLENDLEPTQDSSGSAGVNRTADDVLTRTRTELRRSESALPDIKTLEKIRGTLTIRSKAGSTRSLRGFLGSFGAMASTSDAPVSRSRVATDNSPPVEVEMTRKLTWTCPICLIEEDAGQTAGNGSDIINFSRENLPCSHVFHMCCLADLTRHTLKYKKPFSCPMCRKKFSVSLVKKTASEKRIHLYGNF